MPEFLFDLTCTATARVTAGDLAEAAATLKGELDCYDPGITITNGDGAAIHVTEISLGAESGQPVMSLAEADGETADADLDGMMTPVLCRRAGSDPDCEGVYDEARGDGYQGLCPHCADRSSR